MITRAGWLESGAPNLAREILLVRPLEAWSQLLTPKLRCSRPNVEFCGG
jgi:hypothetical protein